MNQKPQPTPAELAASIDPRMDGIDHIWVSKKANSHLGKVLNIEYPSTFYHPRYGCFISVSSLMAYIQTGGQDESIRFKTDNELKEYLAECNFDPAQNRINVKEKDLTKVWRSAVTYRILGNPEVLEKLLQNELEIKVYEIEKGEVRLHSLWLDKYLNYFKRSLLNHQLDTSEGVMSLLDSITE